VSTPLSALDELLLLSTPDPLLEVLEVLEVLDEPDELPVVVDSDAGGSGCSGPQPALTSAMRTHETIRCSFIERCSHQLGEASILILSIVGPDRVESRPEAHDTVLVVTPRQVALRTGLRPRNAGAGREGALRTWVRMFDGIAVTRAHSVQLWFKRSADELFSHPIGLLTGFAAPEPSLGDFSHLLTWERWGDGPEAPKFLAYHTGSDVALSLAEATRERPPDFPMAAQTQWRERFAAWLRTNYRDLYDRAPASFDAFLDLLVAPEGTQGLDRLWAQFFQMAIQPSDLYILSQPGATALRLAPSASWVKHLRRSSHTVRHAGQPRAEQRTDVHLAPRLLTPRFGRGADQVKSSRASSSASSSARVGAMRAVVGARARSRRPQYARISPMPARHTRPTETANPGSTGSPRISVPCCCTNTLLISSADFPAAASAAIVSRIACAPVDEHIFNVRRPGQYGEINSSLSSCTTSSGLGTAAASNTIATRWVPAPVRRRFLSPVVTDRSVRRSDPGFCHEC
jgi:hypothetical protein